MNTTTIPQGFLNQCVGQFQSLATEGHALLIISIVLAALFALLSLTQMIVTVVVSVKAVLTPEIRQKMAEAGGADATPIPGILDSVKGLIGALSGAPAWFAVFLAGVAVMWMATLFTPDRCLAPPPAPAPVKSDQTSSPSDTTARQVPKAQKGAKPNTTRGANAEAGGM